VKAVNLIFPHQLFENHEIYSNGFPVYMIEEFLFFKEFNFHKQKIAFHRSSMKKHEAYLKKKKIDVKYISSNEHKSNIVNLIPILQKEGYDCIHFINPTDFWIEKRIQEESTKRGIKLVEYENPLFINTRESLQHFFKPTKKSFFQTTFYKQQRVKFQILVDQHDQPLGGKWSFDKDNRKKYPKGKIPPPVLSSDPFFPTDRISAKEWLQQFFEYRFYEFGTYEDAIQKGASILNHSVLSPMMNVGLLTPMEVIEEALSFANDNKVPMNSLEGFVRQIMGWREFIRGMYEVKGVASRTKNFWKFKRKIPESFYNGTTGILPVDDIIKSLLKTGYCHHIERLMILGNFMLLCEFDPKEVYRWFMEFFIDAYDWVMVPNVYGMSQFADGGFFATKPYISGSNYVMKMSNYKKGEWQKTWDGLFWRFMNKHRDFFLKNPRIGMLVHTYDRMSPEKQETHEMIAEKYLKQL